jgi:hypothetical protein
MLQPAAHLPKPTALPSALAKARDMEGVDNKVFDGVRNQMILRAGDFLDAKTPPAQLMKDAAKSVVGALDTLKNFSSTPRIDSLQRAAGQAIDAAAQITASVRMDAISTRDAVKAAAHLRMAEQTFRLEIPTIGLQTAQGHVDNAVRLLNSMIANQ